MQWPWQTPSRTTPEQRLIQIETKLDWIIQALWLIAPGIKDQLPLDLRTMRRPLPTNYRKRGADDVWQASRYASPEDRLTAPPPDPKLNAVPIQPSSPPSDSPPSASPGTPPAMSSRTAPSDPNNATTAPSPATSSSGLRGL